MEPIKMTHMPALICGRGAVKFAATLGRKRAAVIGYTDSVEEKAREIFAGTDTEIRYIASIQREPRIGDIFDNLPALQEFQPDLILAIGGGSVMEIPTCLLPIASNPLPCPPWGKRRFPSMCPPPAAPVPKPRRRRYSSIRKPR